MWISLGNNCTEKLSIMLNNPLSLAKFITNKSIQWTGSTIGWEFDLEDIKQYIEIEKALEIILSLKQTELFKTLPKEVQQLTVAFVLWNRPDREGHDVYMSKVQAELINWL